MLVSVEAIIRAAVERGELDDVPYKGQPLPPDDDKGVHPEDRMAFRVLARAGMVPPEVSAMKALAELRTTMALTDEPAEARRLGKEIAEKEAVLRMRMERNARR